MNVPPAKSMLRASMTAVKAGLCAAALAACADLRRATSLPPVNVESPVAGPVAIAARRNFPVPGFTNVPPAPLNVLAAPAVKTTVLAMVRCRRTFERWDASHPQLVADTKGFATLQRAKADLDPADIPAPEETTRSKAYADSLRAYAEPPPLITSGPPPTVAEASPPAAHAPASPGSRSARVHPAPAKPPAARPSAPASPPARSAAAGPPVAVQVHALVLAASLPAPLADPLLSSCP